MRRRGPVALLLSLLALALWGALGGTAVAQTPAAQLESSVVTEGETVVLRITDAPEANEHYLHLKAFRDPYTASASDLELRGANDAAVSPGGSARVTRRSDGTIEFSVVVHADQEIDSGETFAIQLCSSERDCGGESLLGEWTIEIVEPVSELGVDQGLIPDIELDTPLLGEPTGAVSVLDYLGPDGVYRLRDGNGELPLRLISSSGGDDALVDGDGAGLVIEADLEALTAHAGAAYAPVVSGNGLNGTESTTTAAPSNWFTSDNGQLFLLVGGVNVFFAQHLSQAEIAAILARHNVPAARVEPIGELPNAYLIRTVSDLETLQLVDALSAEPGVASAVPNLYTPLSESPGTQAQSYTGWTNGARQRCSAHPQYPDALSGCLWHLNADTNYRYYGKDPTIDINLGNVYATTMGAGATVAVVDATWEGAHPDLAANADQTRSKYWGGHSGEDPSRDSPYHGTAVAGIVAARDNTIGGRGVAPRATLVNYNFLDAQSTANEVAALTLNKETVAVYNMSYGLISAPRIMRKPAGIRLAIEEGLRSGFGGKGSSYVKGAGNNAGYPGEDWATLEQANNFRGVITVCAVNMFGIAAAYSEQGPSLWICAPSIDTRGGFAGILTTIGKGDYMDRFGGTSASAPIVSGVIALMRSANSDLTWRDVKVILANTAQKNDPTGNSWTSGATKYRATTEKYSFSYEYGFGTVDASAAVQAASSWNLLPAGQTTEVSSSTVVSLPRNGREIALTADVTTDIDFVEHVAIEITADIYDMRDYSWTLVSPSGAESLLSPQHVGSGCYDTLCSWRGTMRFGTNKHLGEAGSGAWKLKVRRHMPDLTVCGNGSWLYNSLCRDYRKYDQQIRSFKLVVFGHKSESGQAVKLTVTPLSVTEGGEVSLTASVEGAAPTTDLVLPLRFTDIDTSPPSETDADYAALASITIPAGSTSATAQLATAQDNLLEADETFTVGLGPVPSGFKRAGVPVTVTIVNGPPARTVTLKTTTASVSEGGSVDITASLSRAAATAVTLVVGVAPISPAVTADGSLSKQATLTITAGETDSTGTVTFTAADNNRYRPSTVAAKQFTISAKASGGEGVADPASIAIEIDDDEPKPAVDTTAGGAVTEGNDVTFTFTASPKPESDIDVSVFIVTNGDYGIATGTQTVTIPTSGTATLSLPTIDDQVEEPDGYVRAAVLVGNDNEQGTRKWAKWSHQVDISDNDGPSTTYTVNPGVVTKVQALAAQTQHGAAHINRWSRVLVAFGEHDGTGVSGGAMTAAEAQQMANRYSSPVWDEVVAELTALEAAASQTPVVSITGGSDVTEGGNVTFTLTASPTPTANLDVTVTIATVGDYGVTAGNRTVTIPSSGSATLTIATTDDQTDETDGSVTATLVDGADHDLGATKTATVTVSDNDRSSVTPVVSISGGASVTEGTSATFTLTASPVPTANLSVSLLIGKVGDYGVNSGFRTVTIPTSGSKTLALATTDDQTDEADGFVSVTVRDGAAYDVGTSSSAQVTILDDDDPPPTPVVSISGGSAVTEGGDVSFTLTASPKPAANLDVTVTIATVGHYGVTAGNRTVTIPSSGSATLTITTTDDQVDETDGSVTATLVDGADYDLGTQKAVTVTVSDNDDPPPGHTVDPSVISQVQALAAQTHHGSAHVNRWNRVLVALGEHDGTGVSGGAMTAVEAQHMANTHSSPVWDLVVVELTALEAAASATPVVSISGGSGVTEGGSVTFTLTTNPTPAADLDVTVTIAAVGDYGVTTGNQTVTIPSSGSKTFTIATTDDQTDETDGSVTATLVDGADYDLGASKTATVTISDDDDPPPHTPVVSISAGGSVTEGTSATFTLTANPVPTANLSVSLLIGRSGDYGVISGFRTVTIPTSGSLSLTIPTTGDKTDEADGVVSATVRDGAAYDVGTLSSAQVMILDDDDPPVVAPVVSISGGSGVTEGGNVTFTLTASPVPTANLDVTFKIATVGDYGVTAGDRTVTIPTSGSKTLTIATTNDQADEADGSVTATLIDGGDYDLGASKAATVTVSDDDDPPTPVVSISGGSGVTEGGNVTFTLTALPKPTANLDVTVTIAAAGDYGVSAGNRTVTLPTSGSVMLTIATADDQTDEADGSVTATLVDGSDYDLGTSKTATVSVSDDDDPPVDSQPDTPVLTACSGPPTLLISSPSASRADATVEFEASLSCKPSDGISFLFAVLREGFISRTDDLIFAVLSGSQPSVTIEVEIRDTAQVGLGLTWGKGIANKYAQGDVQFTD